MQDMAKTLNLSISTISRALSGHPYIKEQTRQRVLVLAQQLGFQPNPLASALLKGQSGIIGVLVPHLTGFFFPEVVHGITVEANRAGMHIMVCESDDTEQHEKDNLQLLLNARVEGVLVSLANATRDFRHFEAARRQVPLVFFDRVIESRDFSSVVLDNYAGAYQAVSHLIGQGCTRIAHFTGDWHLNTFRDRHRGYIEALLAHGLVPDERLQHLSSMSLEQGRAGMAALLALPTPPDGVFSSKDTAAIGACQVVKERGLRVPHDVAFTSFSTEKISVIVEPALTSVDLQCAAMGQAGARLLLELLRAEPRPAAPQFITLPPQLLVRASSQRQAPPPVAVPLAGAALSNA